MINVRVIFDELCLGTISLNPGQASCHHLRTWMKGPRASSLVARKWPANQTGGYGYPAFDHGHTCQKAAMASISGHVTE